MTEELKEIKLESIALKKSQDVLSATLKEKINFIETVKVKSQEEFDASNKEVDTLKESITNLEAHLLQEREISKTLKAQLGSTEVQLKESDSKLTLANGDVESLMTEKTSLEEKITGLNESIDIAQKENDEAIRAVKVAKIEAETAGEDMKKVRDELNNCKVDLQEAKAQIEATATGKDSHEESSAVAELTKKVEERDLKYAALMKEKEEMSKICDELMLMTEARAKEEDGKAEVEL